MKVLEVLYLGVSEVIMYSISGYMEGSSWRSRFAEKSLAVPEIGMLLPLYLFTQCILASPNPFGKKSVWISEMFG